MSDEEKQENQIEGKFLLDEFSRLRRRGAILVWIGLIIITIAIVIGVVLDGNAQEAPIGKIGVHLLLDDGRNRWDESLWESHLAYAGEMASAGGIAVQVIRADDLDVARWQQFMDLAAENDLTPVLRLATTFDFENGWWNAPLPNANGTYEDWGNQYAAFLNGLDWHGAEKYVILLNEPNNGHEWGGRPDAVAYARFFYDVSDVVRRDVEGVVILNAAFDPYAPNTGSLPFPNTNVYLQDANSFMDEMEATVPRVFEQVDIWNSHAYPLALRAHPSEERYNFDFMHDAVITMPAHISGLYNRGINGYAWELWKLEQLGYGALPVMITETGWRHAESTTDSLDAADDYPSAALVAEYFDLALRGDESSYAIEHSETSYRPWLEDERVIGIAPFALNGVPREWGHTNLLQLDESGQVLGVYPAYEILKAANGDG